MHIRAITRDDRETVIDMMRTFYNSPAVYTNGSQKIYEADVDTCLSDSPYLEGYVFEDTGAVCGYAMIAKSFSTEFGKPCMWIEDLYIQQTHRGRGIGSDFLAYIREKYPNAILRLEVEDDNEHAVHVYKKAGFDTLPYREMFKP